MVADRDAHPKANVRPFRERLCICALLVASATTLRAPWRETFASTLRCCPSGCLRQAICQCPPALPCGLLTAGYLAPLDSTSFRRLKLLLCAANDVFCKLLKIKAVKGGGSAALVGSGSPKDTGHHQHLNRLLAGLTY